MTLPARLLDSIASAAVREGLADAVYTRLPTPIGTLLLVQGDARRAARRLRRPGRRRPARRRSPRAPRPADRRLRPRARRDPRRLLRLLRGRGRAARRARSTSRSCPSAFRRTALETLRAEVGPGDVVTYGALAARLGHPKAARAVGTACAINPVPLVVPCHRVVPRGGGVGSYAGGPDVKRRLLAHEGALPLTGDLRSITIGSTGCSSGPTGAAPIRSTTSLPLGDLAEQRVLGRQLGVVAGDDEELAAGGAGRLGAGLGHRHDALRVGRGPAAAPRRRSSRGRRVPVAGGVAALDHEAGDDPVERSCRRRSPCRRAP